MKHVVDKVTLREVLSDYYGKLENGREDRKPFVEFIIIIIIIH